ncbi:MAG: hypothetical protein GY950_32925 [bacterium]|nr:hypothetical protein [bacterium]
MKMHRFLEEVHQSLQKKFPECRVEYLIKTPKSLKANVHLNGDYFIALRFNAKRLRGQARIRLFRVFRVFRGLYFIAGAD